MAKERRERLARVLVVLMRARVVSGGLCSELATAAREVAAVRASLGAWHGRGGSSAWARSGGGGRERRVGASAKQEVAGLALHGDGRRCTAAARNRAGEQAGGRGKGPVCNF